MYVRCWPVMGGRSQNCTLHMGSGHSWLAEDGGRSQHYCGGLHCGLPLVAFWQHNANAKFFAVYLVIC